MSNKDSPPDKSEIVLLWRSIGNYIYTYFKAKFGFIIRKWKLRAVSHAGIIFITKPPEGLLVKQGLLSKNIGKKA